MTTDDEHMLSLCLAPAHIHVDKPQSVHQPQEAGPVAQVIQVTKSRLREARTLKLLGVMQTRLPTSSAVPQAIHPSIGCGTHSVQHHQNADCVDLGFLSTEFPRFWNSHRISVGVLLWNQDIRKIL